MNAQKVFGLAIGIAALLLSVQGEARNFYRANFKMSVQFTDITHGRMELLSEQKINVRYSDDHDYCQILIGPDVFQCKTYHPDGLPESVMITVDRGDGGKLVGAALANCKTPIAIREKFTRLSIYLDDTIDLEWQGKDFYQQIHDEQPEAFHIWLFDMSVGERY
jgi:hypothetical protein